MSLKKKFKVFISKVKIPQGLTLIELLVVLAILGIMVGVLLAIVNPIEQRRKATDAVTQEIAVGFAEGAAAYAVDQDAFPWNQGKCSLISPTPTTGPSPTNTPTPLSTSTPTPGPIQDPAYQNGDLCYQPNCPNTATTQTVGNCSLLYPGDQQTFSLPHANICYYNEAQQGNWSQSCFISSQGQKGTGAFIHCKGANYAAGTFSYLSVYPYCVCNAPVLPINSPTPTFTPTPAGPTNTPTPGLASVNNALSFLSSCSQYLQSQGDLKTSFSNVDSNTVSSIYVNQPDPLSGKALSLSICYLPQSK